LKTTCFILVGNGDKHPSLKARIFFAQSTEMLGMNETSAGTWGPIQLNIPSFPSVVKKLSLKYVIQVVVNFNWFMTTGQCRLLEHLSNLFENPLFSDVCFNINGVELKAHSALLAEASPMFSTILAGNIQENETAIYVTDIEPSIFKEILRYIYTGKAEGLECSGVAEALLIAADKYQIKSLKHICETTLCSNLKSNNVINCLILADIHHASQLKEAAVAFIVKEKAVISEQNDWHKLSKNYPELFFRTIQEMFKLM
jgi:BTB/POZ domain